MSSSDKDTNGAPFPADGEAAEKPEKEKLPRAVALKDRSISGTMPRVVASGKGGIAEQILQIAFANDIKVRQDADLVEVLAAVDVDSEIPLEAFAAVAEILSYVYRANAGYTEVDVPPDAPSDVPEGDSQ